MWVAFKPPVQGATLGPRDVPAMEMSEWRCRQMERLGHILAQSTTVLICQPFGSPISLSPGTAAWVRNGRQQQYRSLLQADLCMRAWLAICAAGGWLGAIWWSGRSKVCSAFGPENTEAERAGGGHLLQQLWWYHKASGSQMPTGSAQTPCRARSLHKRENQVHGLESPHSGSKQKRNHRILRVLRQF